MLFNATEGSTPIGASAMPWVRFGHGKRTLVILPGLSDGLTTVRGKALPLAWSYRRLLDDLTIWVFSRKDPLPEGTSIRDMAADQAEVLRALGLERVSVMGVSQGGMIAQYLAIDHPEMVERLVLAVTAPSATETARACVSAWMKMAEAGGHQKMMADSAAKSYSEAFLRRNRLFLPLLGLVGRPKSYARYLVNARAILAFDAAAEASKITCPTLILGGGRDQIVGPDAAEQLHALIPGSRCHVYPGLGHAAFDEAPDFNGRVRDFVMEEAQEADGK
ncbi:MAG: alpha/beta hydrolase [Clostridia bacterium]|nr:alpha/beta hydrolase [Clostridia bacterium]